MSRSSTLRDSDGIWHTDELLHIHIKSFFLKPFNFSPHQLPNITTNVFKQLPYNPLFFIFYFFYFFLFFFKKEFQLMASAPNDSSISSDQDTNQFLM